MKKRILVLGGSGIGMIAASVQERRGDGQVVGFLNDVLPVGSTVGRYRKIPVVGTTADVGRLIEETDDFFFIAYVGMTREREVYEKISSLPIPPERLATIIDPTAVVPEGYCAIGRGVLIAPLAQLSPDTTVADNCILLPNSFVGHDSVLERFAHVAANAVVGGTVHVGRGVHVGTNATIREKVVVGDFSLVGSGSVVLHDVPEGAIVAGNPARVLRGR